MASVVSAGRLLEPTVVSGSKNRTIALPRLVLLLRDGSADPASGRWVAWAKFSVSSPNTSPEGDDRSTASWARTHSPVLGRVIAGIPGVGGSSAGPGSCSVDVRDLGSAGGKLGRVQGSSSAVQRALAQDHGHARRDLRITSTTAPTTVGSGTPVAIITTQEFDARLAARHAPTVGRIKLPAGKWFGCGRASPTVLAPASAALRIRLQTRYRRQ